jgi:signal transduction histidine kinase
VWPVPAAVVNLFALVAYSALNFPPSPAAVSTLIMLYTLAAHCPRRVSLGWLAVTFASTILILNVDGTSDNFGSYASNFALLAAAWAVGDSLQSRRKYVSELEDRAARLEHEREEKARQAVADERARIARELHDVVAHHVSVMVVQAGGARRMIDQEPARSKEALETIEVTGRDALSEMRRLLGVLREQDEATDDLAPQPRVTDVAELVQSMRDSGLPVDLRVDGESPDLSPGIELSVYRIVQEALTNTLKHAGPARAEVRIRYTADGVEVEVRDDGRGAAVASVNGSGHGIVGMRERVALFGGELELGPRVGGGFRVSARLPVREQQV